MHEIRIQIPSNVYGFRTKCQVGGVNAHLIFSKQEISRFHV